MPTSRKSWHQKLHADKGFPKVMPIETRMSKRWGSGTFVIPAPLEVDELMRRVPRGKVATIDQLRGVLARRHGATIACPLTTGIFAWIAAHAAAETPNRRDLNPFWRTLKSNGELNAKYPGGIALLKKKLRAEGHVITQKGKRFFVKDFAEKLARL